MDVKLQVGVKAFLQNKEGKYLLLKRSRKKYPTIAGLWDIVGGRIEPGVPLFENLKREVWEEVQMELKETPTLVDATDILRVPGRHVVRLTYSGHIDGEPHLDLEEVEEYRWVSIKEMKELDDLDIYTKQLLDKNILK
jgi:8-oxo-dGTP pyrophosphatase MutT (NUDIX family)